MPPAASQAGGWGTPDEGNGLQILHAEYRFGPGSGPDMKSRDGVIDCQRQLDHR